MTVVIASNNLKCNCFHYYALPWSGVI